VPGADSALGRMRNHRGSQRRRLNARTAPGTSFSPQAAAGN
jgi:hypothetical protein